MPGCEHFSGPDVMGGSGLVSRTMSLAYTKWQAERQIEFLWAGPFPANRIPVQRIDQVFYDLIGVAHRDVMLVTFAAAKIQDNGHQVANASSAVPVATIFDHPSESGR
jgi:hypothetical protein